MPRYLVTGAAGFIGSNLARTLASQGAEVFGVDNFRSGHRANLEGFTGQFLEGDVTDSRTVEKLTGRWDAVFHHGDITDPRYDGPDCRERNLRGFGNLLALSRQTGARLVYASTAGLYGNGPTPMREDQPKELLTEYGKSKYEMDVQAAESASPAGTVGLRYFNVFGPGEIHKGRAASMVYHLARQMAEGHRPRLFKFGEQKRDFIYVDDVVHANLCALRAPSGVYNVGSGVATSFNDLVKALNSALGTDLAPEYIDMPYAAETYQHNTHADTRLAESRLEFKTRWDFTRAVRDYVVRLGLAAG